jgi:3-oxoacyl-[acyl-carrier-protein] synthase-1
VTERLQGAREGSGQRGRSAAVWGIAGYSTVNAGGRGNAASWQSMATGRCGLQRNALPWCDLNAWIGEVAGVDDVELPPALRAWDCRNHRLAWLALQGDGFAAAVRAAAQRHGPHRVAVVLGTSTSGIHATERAYAAWKREGRFPPDFAYRRTHALDALCRFVAAALEVTGPMVTVSTACSSSAKVFVTARRWLECGLADAAVVGGADSLCLSTLHGFDALQLLGAGVCRPFDVNRQGLSIGEAAGFVLLDRQPRAVNFLGGGESSDAWHMSTPHPEGLGAQDAMRGALRAAGLQPRDIGYVNAHGTATVANDRAEALALSAVFGACGVPVSSTKGVTGHTLGAAGVVEAIAVVQALQQGRLPPSANLEQADPALAIDVVTAGRPLRLRHAMTNSFGFGGNNCSLVFGLGH